MEEKVAVQVVRQVPVSLAPDALQTLSKALYTHPHKSIEELVVNAYDAAAKAVEIYTSEKLADPDAFIGVVENGISMDAAGFEQLWGVGGSSKRTVLLDAMRRLGRLPIGKFGIGKLAPFFVAKQLTYICKCGGQYHRVVANITDLAGWPLADVSTRKIKTIAVEELAEGYARQVIPAQLLTRCRMKLFGVQAERSWTIALLTHLEPSARELEGPSLELLLRMSMPLSSDFRISLNGTELQPYRPAGSPSHTWVLGKDILPPSLTGLVDQLEVDVNEGQTAYGLRHPLLGRVTGSVALYSEKVASVREEVYHTHGCFVYVRGRLLNAGDPYFGVPANTLKIGLLSRLRIVLHADRLDAVITAARERVSESDETKVVRSLISALFNWSRRRDARTPRLSRRTASNIVQRTDPAVLEQPILEMLRHILAGRATSALVAPVFNREDATQFIKVAQERLRSGKGLALGQTDLGASGPISQFDPDSWSINSNSAHPFVSTFLKEGRQLSELVGVTEVATAAYLLEAGIDENIVQSVMQRRDTLLREFARNYRGRSSAEIANELRRTDLKPEEAEKLVVEALKLIGFTGGHVGNSGRPDGIVSVLRGTPHGYSVALEVKTTRKSSRVVSAKDLDIAAVIRHRDENDCQHALIVAPLFSASEDANVAAVRSVQQLQVAGKTITMITFATFARLVEVLAENPLALVDLRVLFAQCRTPGESEAFLEGITKRPPRRETRLREVLEAAEKLQARLSQKTIGFEALTSHLLEPGNLEVSKWEVVSICQFLAASVPDGLKVISDYKHDDSGNIVVDGSIELRTSPKQILHILQKSLGFKLQLQ